MLVQTSAYLGGVIGGASQMQQQLVAVQASFRSAMAELATQTEANQALSAELRQLRKEKEQRKTALRVPALTPPRQDGASEAGGEERDGGEASGAGERPATAAEAAAQKTAAEAACKALTRATSEFESVRGQMEAVAAQRQRLLEGAQDIAWQLEP